MRMKKSISLAAICMLVISMLAGCGTKFDASKYVQAQLDNSFKNDSSLIVEQKIASAEEASDVYEQGVDTVVDNFFIGVSVSDEKITDIGAKYTADAFAGEGLIVKRGKKKFAKIIMK